MPTKEKIMIEKSYYRFYSNLTSSVMIRNYSSTLIVKDKIMKTERQFATRYCIETVSNASDHKDLLNLTAQLMNSTKEIKELKK